MDLNSLAKEIPFLIKDSLKIGPRNLVGIDIGLSSVKVCELAAKGSKWALQKFAMQELPEGALIDDEIQKPDEIKEAIKEALKKAKIKNLNVCLGLFGPNTIAKRLQIAGNSEEEIENEVFWEAEQYIPFGVDDSAISYDILRENEGGGTDVIVAAAREDVIESYKDLLGEIGLRVKVVDLNLLATANVFEHIVLNGKDASVNNVLIEFGAQSTKVSVYKFGVLVFTRELNIGGYMITEEIQRQMGLNYVEAEDLKTLGDENGNYPEEILEIIQSSLDVYFAEIRKVLGFFLTASSDDEVDKCFLTGGACMTPGLKEGLETTLNCKIHVFDPFLKIDYNKRSFSQEAIEIIATHGVVAMGLAARNF
ncbi:MAG: type IV pilus assembly protein PilM [Bacteriovoracaceae bacterium]|jgi:type IV pilus assembly protein PilM|nr:type IV pilus assembly protein PilM [Bacteriovoracaceae bacterium]